MIGDVLYVLCSLFGGCIIVGAIWLLYQRKIYIDSQTGQPTQVEFPFLGKIKTQSPVLLLFALGVFLLVYPVQKWPQQYKTFEGKVNSNLQPVNILAVCKTGLTGGDGSFEIAVPKTRDPSPPLLYFLAGPNSRPLVDDEQISPQEEVSGKMPPVEMQIPETAGSQQAVPFQPVVNPRPAEFQH